MLKKTMLTTLLIIISSTCFGGNLIHPLDFDGSPEEKKKVISYIQKNVKKTYTEIGMGDPATLRMMEEEELSCFKKLTQVTNRGLLDGVINQYCSIGMCNYSTILMMYDEQKKASKKKLQW